MELESLKYIWHSLEDPAGTRQAGKTWLPCWKKGPGRPSPACAAT